MFQLQILEGQNITIKQNKVHSRSEMGANSCSFIHSYNISKALSENPHVTRFCLIRDDNLMFFYDTRAEHASIGKKFISKFKFRLFTEYYVILLPFGSDSRSTTVPNVRLAAEV